MVLSPPSDWGSNGLDGVGAFADYKCAMGSDKRVPREAVSIFFSINYIWHFSVLFLLEKLRICRHLYCVIKG